MLLKTGQRLNQYEIIGPLGAGGMGEVYRALDTRLDREVAIKVLPETVAQDPERLARFDREAKLLASLNHPGIAAIYDLQQEGGAGYLVMELVPGETLGDRIHRAPISLSEALEIGRQIAEALEAAHEKGIIHRDLKPANVQITPDGVVKILDFGLAKALEDPAAQDSGAESPTLTYQATQAGVLLGTAAYMSPEQACGKPVDRRADIWAFGCVLFELLTGKKTFQGDSVTETLATVLKGEPEWRYLPPSTPAPLRKVLQRCLQKNPKQRLRDIADARMEMEEVLAEGVTQTAPSGVLSTDSSLSVSSASGRSTLVPWIIAGILALSTAWLLWSQWSFSEIPPRTLRANIPIGAKEAIVVWETFGTLSLSPDGSRLVYRGSHEGNDQLYLRSLDGFESTPLPQSQSATGPFFSPDGQWIGFFAPDNKLKKIAISGGAPVTLANVTIERGGSWGDDGTILYAPSAGSGIWRIPAGGGAAEEAISPDRESGEVSYRWPEFLPGSQAFLFTIKTNRIQSFDEAQIAIFDFQTGERRVLIEGGSHARYLPTGHLVFGRMGSLVAVPFDLASLELAGNPTVVIEDVTIETSGGVVQYAVSADGTLVYVKGGATLKKGHVAWIDRQGNLEVITEEPQGFNMVTISPDGERVAASLSAANNSIWLYELERGTLRRLTQRGGNEFRAVWNPSSEQIAFSSDLDGTLRIILKDADGDEPGRPLWPSDAAQYVGGWSPDGEVFAFWQRHPETSWDIWTIRPEEGEEARPLVATPAEEKDPAFSPDGKFLAFTSDESGRKEVYVQPFPGPGRKWQISIGGGFYPVWGRDGRELYYLDGGGTDLMSVSVRLEPSFRPGTPKVVFKVEDRMGDVFQISPDGKRFLFIIEERESEEPEQLNLIVNWFEELKRLAPSGGAP